MEGYRERTSGENINNNVSPETIFKTARERMVMTDAYEKALNIIESGAIKPEQFTDTYSESLLQKCQNYVDQREEEFTYKRANNENWARAEVFGKTLEAILHDQINKGVYGEEVRGVMTAKYDDYHAGIDEVIERQSSDGTTHIGCALDFTFGDPKKKIQGIYENITAGKLSDVTFYESPFGNPPQIHGKLQGIPKVVIGMDSSHLIDLAQEWLEDDSEALKNNQLFLSLLRQIQIQSEVYETIAKRAGQTETASRYKHTHQAISKLYMERKIALGVDMIDEEITNDLVNQSLRTHMSQLMNMK